ncbi:hypothetical protein BKA58DRAFT_443497 [Alternaria rosae]|uniref:uncharacterized protein n=1 Tax=Alternaria rosae TaxID=1187941 RepID=UPI001E8E4793|nr:uncharacterized protein BKA58DRAFT_443497 [Alternaria rosae]KAH6860717.1 hypothetical protein BKA58DRAFT_443497 [Alternaria rosae]
MSNRVQNGDEQYLVRWTSETLTTKPPLSWHSVKDLVRCLEKIQDYLEVREKNLPLPSTSATQVSRKRKSPSEGSSYDRRSSPFDRRLQESHTPSLSRSSSVSSAATITSSVSDIYNGVLDANQYGYIFCRQVSGHDIPELDIRTVSTPEMNRIAHRSSVDKALTYIRNEYVRRLAKVPGKPIHLFNVVDRATPSLRFRYISEYVLDEQQGIYRASVETQQGCQQCSPHMGRDIGCEYTKRCDCLEYAAVDESRLDEEGRREYQLALENGDSTMGFPKKFPYFAEGTKREKTGCLVPFYLNSRRPIYECNDRCKCGPKCRNKNVQFGRQVEVEIFRANDGRGWGLRCKQDLHEGQFIDTYRGEVITDAEATHRETSSSKAKASYLYSLDKFAESEGLEEEDLYVVDGEFMGGPTKFINHSCDPNCRQYTVSYNKHDPRVYDIAFFARRFIPKGEELTFDYLDKEEEEEMDEPGEGALPCLCGAENCRKWLWT